MYGNRDNAQSGMTQTRISNRCRDCVFIGNYSLKQPERQSRTSIIGRVFLLTTKDKHRTAQDISPSVRNVFVALGSDADKVFGSAFGATNINDLRRADVSVALMKS